MINIRMAGSVAVATHCPYCSLQCGMRVTRDAAIVSGDEEFPVNNGALCVKGWTAAELLNHPERLLRPLKRNTRGALAPVGWDEAFKAITQALRATQSKHGRDAVGVLGGGSLTNEKAYLLGKFARVALRTANIDYNGRFCMSSAAAASIKAFGIDRGLPFPIADIARAEVILLVGANPAETMPPLMRYFELGRATGGRLIVADPRRTITAQSAQIHLRLIPGTDAALAGGLLHILIRDGLVDETYIRERTEGFSEAKAVAATYWPDRVERITGVAEARLVEVAQALGNARSAMILTARGPEQQSQGVNNVLSFINLALALGLPGRSDSGFGSITGQGNGQGGREHGQKADQLPGYRRIDDPAARSHVARVWRVEESEIPGPGRSANKLLRSLGDEIRALFTLGFNFAVSAPDACVVIDRARRLDFLCATDFFLSETARMADVVLPAAMWAEEEGTMTNLEGRVIRRRRVKPPPPGVKSDIEIICELAARLGRGRYFNYANVEEIFNELRSASQGGVADYSGITWQKIEANQGVYWPCPDETHPGAPRLFTRSFPTPSGRARFHAARHTAVHEETDAEYPLFLTTGRLLAQYQSGAQTRRIARLCEVIAEPCAEIHPRAAAQYEVRNGETINLVTRRGSARFKVKVTPGIREDTIFVPFHWGDEQSVNRLTNAALDPVSGMPEFKVCAVRVEKLET
ncbi:MAG TPA: molybdopterin oxidoreductase family protein [Blastocatellia bacterium]|nr:molybdopterin oxidoreductase family protein [Blastocatellia bacterium]